MRRRELPIVLRMVRDLQVFHKDKLRINVDDLAAMALSRNGLIHIWVILSQKTLVGFIATHDWFNLGLGKKIRVVNFLYIDEQYRGKGIGSNALAQAARLALKNGIERMDIGASKKNRKANILYQNLGFTKRTNFTNEYKIENKSLKKLGTSTQNETQ